MKTLKLNLKNIQALSQINKLVDSKKDLKCGTIHKSVGEYPTYCCGK